MNILKGWRNYFFRTWEIEVLAWYRKKKCIPCTSNILGVCKECGCPLALKRRVIDESCDLNKW